MDARNTRTIDEKVRVWLEVARWAPSGGNAQPWHVECRIAGNSAAFRISIDPTYRRGPSAMDVEGMASAIAIGGFAFNLEQAAANDGFKLNSKRVISAPLVWDGAVELSFVFGATVTFFSNDEIRSRQTERTPFTRRNLPDDLCLRLRQTLADDARIKFVEFSNSSPTKKNQLVAALAPLERVRWQNESFLDSLLKELSDDAIPLGQLGVSRFDQMVLRLLQRFTDLRALFRIGFERIAASKAVTSFVRDCDRIFFLQFTNEAGVNDFETCFSMGRIFQKAWLTANRQGIGFQPLGLPLVALSYWRAPDKIALTKSQENTIRKQTEIFEGAFDLDLRKPMLGFRVGYPNKISGRTSRKPVDDFAEISADRSSLVAF